MKTIVMLTGLLAMLILSSFSSDVFVGKWKVSNVKLDSQNQQSAMSATELTKIKEYWVAHNSYFHFVNSKNFEIKLGPDFIEGDWSLNNEKKEIVLMFKGQLMPCKIVELASSRLVLKTDYMGNHINFILEK